MLTLAGIISIDTSVRAVTVRVTELEVIFPNTAVIDVVPVDNEVASPLKPEVLLIDATDGAAEFQVTDAVISFMDEFENVPRTVNCSVIPTDMLGFVGATARDTSVGVGLDVVVLELTQLVSSNKITKRSGTLFDFIDRNSLRDQSRYISAALQVSHMSPCFHDHAVCFQVLEPLAAFAGRLTLGFTVFVRVGTEKLRQIRVDQTVPGYGEDDAGR